MKSNTKNFIKRSRIVHGNKFNYSNSISVMGMSIGESSGYMRVYQYLKTYYPNKLTDRDNFMFDDTLAKEHPEIFQEYKQAEAVHNL